MRAVVYRGNEVLDVANVPVPAVGEHDVLVRVAYCGVCGTDLHIVFGDGGWGVPGSVYRHTSHTYGPLLPPYRPQPTD